VMHIVIIICLFVTPISTIAGIRDFCNRIFVAQDPYPYQEYDNRDLIKWYKATRNYEIKREIIYRIQNGILHPIMVGEFYQELFQ